MLRECLDQAVVPQRDSICRSDSTHGCAIQFDCGRGSRCQLPDIAKDAPVQLSQTEEYRAWILLDKLAHEWFGEKLPVGAAWAARVAYLLES
jgi:hypothetical protein